MPVGARRAQARQDGPVPTIIVRSLLGRVASLVVLAGALLVALSVLTSDGLAGLLPFLGWGGLLGVAVWGLWWAPLLVLADDGLRVRNMWRSYRLTWDEVVGCRSRWVLALLTRDGSEIAVAAAQRPGGLASSWAERQRLRRHEMFGRVGRGQAGVAVSGALEHRGVREDFLDPSDRTFRTHLDAAGAADLLEAYRERRADHERLRARQARRRQRLAAARGHEASASTQAGRQAGDRAAGRDTDRTGERVGVAARTNIGPCAALGVSLLLIIVSFLVR